MSCGIGHRYGSAPVLLWLWHRLAAVAPIGPLAWEPPYAAGVALKRQKDKKKKKCSEPWFKIKSKRNLRGDKIREAWLTARTGGRRWWGWGSLRPSYPPALHTAGRDQEGHPFPEEGAKRRK